MRPNLITRLKEEWNNLDPVDPLRGLIADAIDALTEKPAHQQEPVAWLHPANASDCPVHNEPAWPNGPCDCGAQPEQEPKLPEFYARFEDGVVSVYQRREDETPLLLLRENLPGKQPAQRQEPVAYRCWNNPKNADGTFDSLRIWVSLKPEGYGNEPLYTSPQPSKPEKK